VAISCLILFCAVMLDAMVGDPRAFYCRVPHPIVLIGNTIAWLERRSNHAFDTTARQFWAGTIVTILMVGVTALLGFGIHAVAHKYSYGWLAEAIFASTLLAARGLYDHVVAVAIALTTSLAGGRERIAEIVGRDPNALDTAGIARAAIESAAENFVDGFVAPAFWFAVLGMPGLLAYKTVNTLDSMIGHRNERYEYFGKFAARLDDVANWIPARLGAAALALAAAIIPGASASRAWATACQDARRHRSVNAGWPEAAMAGALNLALAGPRQYVGYAVADAWMGRGRCTLNASDIHRALRLYIAATVIATVMVLALCWLMPA
jgi:adenosylcobinamide-phosphate synthase